MLHNRPLRQLNRYFFKYRRLFFAGCLCVILSNVFAVYGAIYVREALNRLSEALGNGSPLQNTGSINETLLFYAMLILGTAIIRGVFMYFMRQTLIVMSRHVEYDLKNDIYHKYQQLDTAFYRRHSTGDLMNRISEDVGRVRMYAGPAVLYFVNLVAMFAVVLFCMFSVDVQLTVWSLTPLPVLAVSIFLVNNLIERRSDAMQAKLSDVTSFVQETFSGLRVIKAFRKEAAVTRAFEMETEVYRHKSMASAMVEALWFPAIVVLIGLSNILVVFVGGLAVLDGRITVGNIAEFVIYLNMLAFPVTSLGWVASIRQRARASQIRINEFLQQPTDISGDKHALPVSPKLEIVFANVGYTYAGAQTPALQSISFTLPVGQSLGVVGATGSGKSTLAALLLRMADPTEGQILIDGTPLPQVQLEYWRGHIGYVPQDVFLFSDTIEANVAFGKKPHWGEGLSIEDALKLAHLWQNVQGFSQGVNTLIGERGVTLSGGQKQRLSLARALVGNPPLLVLDDCLSAVDTETESQILQSLKHYQQNRTSLIVSHRISSVIQCQQIIVLANGRIAEQGTHAQLIEANGLYCNLYQKQLDETFK